MSVLPAIRRVPSLTAAVYGFVLLSAFVASVIMLFGIRNETRQYEHAVQSSALHMRAVALEQSLSETLEREWASLSGVAAALPEAGRDEAGRMLDMVVRGGVVSWAGFAGTDGRISVASGRAQEGADATAQEWFQRGLEGAYAADASGMPMQVPTQKPRAVDLAHPVERKSDEKIGVLAYHIDADWPRRAIEQKASELGLDVFLLTPDRQVRLRVGEAIAAPLQLPDLEKHSSSAPLLDYDAAGNSFLTTVHSLSLTNMPPLGWLLVTRLSGQTPGDMRAELTAGMITLLAGLFAEVMLATYAFIRIFIRPVRDLAANALTMAEGGAMLPLERPSSREARELSSALSHMQQVCAGSSAYTVPDFLSLVGERTVAEHRKSVS